MNIKNFFLYYFICLSLVGFSNGLADDGEPVPKRTKYHRSKYTRDESEIKADKRNILLTTGEDKPVDLDFEISIEKTGEGFFKGISVGNRQTVSYDIVKIGDKKQIIFKPLKAGETTVTVRDLDGNIRLIFKVIVTGSNLLRRASEVRGLLRDIEGIEIKIVGQKIVIDGEVLVPADYGRLLSVSMDRMYSDLILNLTTISPLAMQALSKKIQEDINTFAPNVRTRVVNGQILLEGTVENSDQNIHAREIATIYLPEVRPVHPIIAKDQANAQVLTRSLIKNLIIINPAPPKKQEKLVRVTVHFVELGKDFNRFFGFKWEPGITEQANINFGKSSEGAPAVSGTTFQATIASLFPVLKTAQDAGYARVLKTGTVIVRSGQPASLNETTEIPFVQIGANGQGIPSVKNVGLKVAVTPLILGQSEDIQLDLNLNQVTELQRGSSGGPPIVSNHEVQTKLYVKSKESAAVAGVVASSTGTDFNKQDPNNGVFTGDTKPLFSLLHSKNYKKKKSQFVIFVTPEIIENASDGTEDLKKNFRVKVK